MSGTIVHCCLDVENALRDRRLDAKTATACVIAKAMGYAVIPFGPCDNFDYQTGCQGHSAIEDKQ